jgi:hypothetical protein
MSRLAIIVPTRARPWAVQRTVEAWRNTGAGEVADLIWAVDSDDPTLAEYVVQFGSGLPDWAMAVTLEGWRPMVRKLDEVASAVAAAGDHEAIGFMGDDHVPRTNEWAQRFLRALRSMGTGIVYGDDLLQRDHLPTQWAMTADIVRSLDRMVPAPVEHLFCDNSVLALGRALRCIRYLGDVVIEHCHPLAGKAEPDPQYERVNSDVQNRTDRTAYTTWLGSEAGLAADVERVRAGCGLS